MTPILNWNGSYWDPIPSGTTQNLDGIFGIARTNIWAVGGTDAGTIVNTVAGQWNSQSLEHTSVLAEVWGSSERELWAVGSGGTIVRLDGQTWVQSPTGTTQDLFAIWGSDANNIWVIGAGGVILKYQR